MKFTINTFTHQGLVRDHNEDDYVYNPALNSQHWTKESVTELDNNDVIALVVCDGMGGLSAGEVASRLTCEFIQNQLQVRWQMGIDREQLLKKILIDANTHLCDYLKQHTNIREMGTTVVLALIESNTCHTAWVGDSRCYLFRNNKLYPVSIDHSPVQELVNEGRITEEEAFNHPQANYISQSIGQSESPKPDYRAIPLYSGDKIFLCTDGVCGEVRNSDIAACFDENNDLATLEKIKGAVFETGAADNLTMLLLTVIENGVAAPLEDAYSAQAAFETKAISGAATQRVVTPKHRSAKLFIYSGVFALLLVATSVGLFTKRYSIPYVCKPPIPVEDTTKTKKKTLADSADITKETIVATPPEKVNDQVRIRPTTQPHTTQGATASTGQTIATPQTSKTDSPKSKPNPTLPITTAKDSLSHAPDTPVSPVGLAPNQQPK